MLSLPRKTREKKKQQKQQQQTKLEIIVCSELITYIIIITEFNHNHNTVQKHMDHCNEYIYRNSSKTRKTKHC